MAVREHEFGSSLIDVSAVSLAEIAELDESSLRESVRPYLTPVERLWNNDKGDGCAGA